MLTAKQARELMPKRKISTLLSEVFEKIEINAAADRDSARISSLISDEERFAWIADYVYHGKKDGTIGLLIAELTKLGYTCTNVYEERQFVDMDVIVSWE